MTANLVFHQLPATMEFGQLAGVSDPPSAQAFKRGVLKSAPSEFSVDILSPAKHGGAFSYGLRICPLRSDIRSSDVRSVKSDKSWSTDYEIWRRWEDCLHFQEVLEDEYAQMSREKRKRLKSGKGIKKGGVYKTSDFAASFDSLPPGPDYHDIATDVHEYLPRLTKKGTLFRPNQSLIATRGREFEALINALWQEDPPTLIRELREQMRVRDFFGFWRRDQDRLRKSGIQGPLGSPGLYGTASASCVSLVPTISGQGSPGSRSSTSTAMFLKLRATEDASSTHPSTQDDSCSITSVPPYSPPLLASPRFPQQQQHSSGDDEPAPKTPRTPQPAQELFSDEASMKFVFDPSDVAPVDPNYISPPPRAPGHRPPTLILPETGKRVAMDSPPPPRSVLAAQTPRSPSSPSPRMARKNSQPSPSSKANRSYRIFTATSEEEAQYAIVPEAFDRTSAPPLPQSPPRRPVKQPIVRTSVSPSPQSVSPPNSATLSTDSASSCVGSSMFATDDSSPSSRRSSWRTDSDDAEADKAVSKTRGTGHETAIEKPLSSPRAHAPPSYRDPKLQSLDYPRHSVSSSETIQKPPSSPSPESIRATRDDSDDTPPHGLRASVLSTSQKQTPSPHDSIDLIDAYFDNAILGTDDRTTTTPDKRPTSSHSVAQSSSARSDRSRKCIHFDIPSPDRFPAPFQHRPPGQFHLPWSPTHPQNTPPYNGFFPKTSPAPPSPPPELSPTFAIKAMYGDAIIVLKVERTISLEDVRKRIHDKFVLQEEVPLEEDFVLSYRKPKQTTAAGVRPGLGRLRSHSTSTVSTISSLSTIDPSQLSFIVLDTEWNSIVSTCGPKLTLIVLDS